MVQGFRKLRLIRSLEEHGECVAFLRQPLGQATIFLSGFPDSNKEGKFTLSLLFWRQVGVSGIATKL